MLKLYVYGYLHQLTSSRKVEREADRNIELMWLTGEPLNSLGGQFEDELLPLYIDGQV